MFLFIYIITAMLTFVWMVTFLTFGDIIWLDDNTYLVLPCGCLITFVLTFGWMVAFFLTFGVIIWLDDNIWCYRVAG
jgi:hypothetical protein